MEVVSSKRKAIEAEREEAKKEIEEQIAEAMKTSTIPVAQLQNEKMQFIEKQEEIFQNALAELNAVGEKLKNEILCETS